MKHDWVAALFALYCLNAIVQSFILNKWNHIFVPVFNFYEIKSM